MNAENVQNLFTFRLMPANIYSSVQRLFAHYFFRHYFGMTPPSKKANSSLTKVFFLINDIAAGNREIKIECALGNKEILFMVGQESQECCIYISGVGIRSIYLSLTLGMPKSNN